VCDCSDQAAHYHNLGPQLGASLLTRHIGWKQKKKERKKEKKGNRKIQRYVSDDQHPTVVHYILIMKTAPLMVAPRGWNASAINTSIVIKGCGLLVVYTIAARYGRSYIL
jgi:hypothetical protein